MKSKLKTLSVATAMVLGASWASVGHADPVVSWSYDTSATFIVGSTDFTAGGGTTFASLSELSWGATGGAFDAPPRDRSALTIGTNGSLQGGGTQSGFITTYNTLTGNIGSSNVGVGPTFTHWNNSLDGTVASLDRSAILDTLTLTPLVDVNGGSSFPPPGFVDAPTLTIGFEFLETPNDPDSGLCVDGSAVGSNGPGCPDLWGLTLLDATPPVPGGDLNNIPLSYDGTDYILSIVQTDGAGGSSPIGALDGAECEALFGVEVDCVGFRTRENQTTTNGFAFTIGTELPVPAPATVALLGIGLAGFGWRLRGRRA